MALLKILRQSQITLPVELRKQFNLAEGDYVEAQAIEEGILLKPITVMERKKAWEGVVRVLDRVHAKLPKSKKSPNEQEEEIAGMIKNFRKRHA